MPSNRSPIREKDELLGYLREGATPPGRWGVGVEYEQIGLSGVDLAPLPHAGSRSVEAVLAALQSRFGWEPVRERGRIIGLTRNGANVTLEPGGQVELSGRVHPGPEGVRRELDRFQGELRAVSDPLRIDWLPIGLHPFAHLEEIPWMPKERYRVLADHLSSTGRLAHHMMKKTAGVQVNLDFRDEADAMEKFRVAMGLTSIVTAVFANSPITEGKPNRYMSARAHIWMNTDPARCGLLPFAFEPDLSFERYVDYALDVPSLFLVRDGAWVGTGGLPFRVLLNRGWDGEPLRMEDWALHLTGLFPEVRLKRYLEIRGADAATVPRAVALAAFWIGILYDEEARRAAWRLVDRLDWAERIALHESVCREGLRAPIGDRSAGELAARLVALARTGLERRGDDAGLLEPIESIIAGGGSPARHLLRRWEEEGWAERPAELVAWLRHGKPARPEGGA